MAGGSGGIVDVDPTISPSPGEGGVRASVALASEVDTEYAQVLQSPLPGATEARDERMAGTSR